MSWDIDIPWSLNSSDTFPRRKFENWPLTSCIPGLILSIPTISFELHAKVVEIYLEMYIYGQLSEAQMVRDLDLDLGSGQGHINIHSTCRTTSMLKHVTVASRTTEIRPFEFREISTNGEVWTLVIAFLGGNKTRKPHKGAAIIAASMHGFASCRKFKSPVTLTLTLDRVKVTSTYTVYVGLTAYPTMWL